MLRKLILRVEEGLEGNWKRGLKRIWGRKIWYEATSYGRSLGGSLEKSEGRRDRSPNGDWEMGRKINRKMDLIGTRDCLRTSNGIHKIDFNLRSIRRNCWTTLIDSSRKCLRNWSWKIINWRTWKNTWTLKRGLSRLSNGRRDTQQFIDWLSSNACCIGFAVKYIKHLDF